MIPKNEIRKHRKLLTERDRELSATFKALGDLHRFRIFRILAEMPLVSVSTLAAILDISTPLASQHIKALVTVKLLTKNRSGKIIYLQLNLRNPVVEEIVRSIRRGLKVPAGKKLPV